MKSMNYSWTKPKVTTLLFENPETPGAGLQPTGIHTRGWIGRSSTPKIQRCWCFDMSTCVNPEQSLDTPWDVGNLVHFAGNCRGQPSAWAAASALARAPVASCEAMIFWWNGGMLMDVDGCWYPLVICTIAMENHHAINGTIHYFNGHFQ